MKVMTRDPVNGNRHFEGRLKAFQDSRLWMELTPRKKSKKHEAVESGAEVEIQSLANVGEGEPGSGDLGSSRRHVAGGKQIPPRLKPSRHDNFVGVTCKTSRSQVILWQVNCTT